MSWQDANTLEGVTANYRCAIRLVLTLIFACVMEGGKPAARSYLGCVVDRITNSRPYIQMGTLK